jgi:glycosyltransferase involved in cell wall biosynthesis
VRVEVAAVSERMSGAAAAAAAAAALAPAREPGSVRIGDLGIAAREPSRRLRILMVVESSAGGTGRHVLDLSRGLIDRGCEVHLLYSPRRMDRAFQDRLPRVPGLRHRAVPIHTAIHPTDVTAVHAARRYLRDFGPFDAIHGHSSKGGAIARLAALWTGVPAVYTLHGLIIADPGLASWKRLLYLAIERGLGMATARIIAVSPEEQRAAIRLGFGAERVILVPNGVDEPALVPRAAARQALNMPGSAFVVGFVGRLVEQKAPDVMLRAFARVAPAAPHALLALVGYGPLERSLRGLAADLGIAHEVLWLGERDAAGIMAAFDLLALPSRREGLPYVALEAMAAGLPIVATESAGIELLVEPGVNGDVVRRDDAGAFATALLKLIRDTRALERAGAASRERATRFTVARMVDATLAAYHGCVGGVHGRS